MNTDKLAKHYDTLTPRERLPLLIAAHRRGDEQEVTRLLESAPQIDLTVRDCAGLAQGVAFAAILHCMRSLDCAYWLLLLVGASDTDVKPARTEELAKCFAYFVLTYRKGWELFCTELGVDPDALLEDLPARNALARAQDLAEAFAPSPDEMAGSPTGDESEVRHRRKPAKSVRLRIVGSDDELITPESIADELRDLLPDYS